MCHRPVRSMPVIGYMLCVAVFSFSVLAGGAIAGAAVPGQNSLIGHNGSDVEANSIPAPGQTVYGAYENLDRYLLWGGTGGSATNAAGGTALYVAGPYSNSVELDIYGGFGGPGAGATGGRGLEVQGNFTNTSSWLQALGGNSGSGPQANGGLAIYVIGDAVNSGKMRLLGGDNSSGSGNGSGGTGMLVMGNFINNAEASLTADGGRSSLHGSRGLEVLGFIRNDGSISAHGASGTDWVQPTGGTGLYVANGLTNTGRFYTHGGMGGAGAHAGGGSGTQLDGDLINNGRLQAMAGAGGSGPGALGGDALHIGGNLINRDTFFSFGGSTTTDSGTYASGGIGTVLSGTLVNSGQANAYAGWTQAGAAASGGMGLLVQGDILNTGTFVAGGGEIDDNLSRSVLPTSIDAIGAAVTGDFLNSGSVMLLSTRLGAGLHVGGSFASQAGAITLLDSLDNGTACALQAESIRFEAGSQLIWNNSFIGVASSFVFEEGAELARLDTLAHGIGTTLEGILAIPQRYATFSPFQMAAPAAAPAMDQPAAVVPAYTWTVTAVDVHYDIPDTLVTPTWRHEFSVTQNNELAVRSTKQAAVSTMLDSSTLGALFAGLESSPGMADTTNVMDRILSWQQFYAHVDGAATLDAMRQRAATVVGGSTPQGASQTFGLMQGQQRLAREAFINNMAAAGRAFNPPQAAPPAVATATDSAATPDFATASGPAARYTVWAQPFHQFGTQDAVGAGFSTMDQRISGISAGAGIDLGAAVFGLAAHYANGRLRSGNYNADIESAGLQAAVGKRLAVNDLLNPWVQLHAGYTWQDINQYRRDILNNIHNSEPDARLLNLGGLVSNDFALGSVRLSPRLGLDYTFIELDSYTEQGSLPLAVRADNLYSLSSTVGTDMHWQANDWLALQARAYYRYEFLDTQAEMKSDIVGLPGVGFATKSPDVSRHSGQLGAGMTLQLSECFSISFDYDLWLAEKYTGHQFGGVFKLEF